MSLVEEEPIPKPSLLKRSKELGYRAISLSEIQQKATIIELRAMQALDYYGGHVLPKQSYKLAAMALLGVGEIVSRIPADRGYKEPQPITRYNTPDYGAVEAILIDE